MVNEMHLLRSHRFLDCLNNWVFLVPFDEILRRAIQDSLNSSIRLPREQIVSTVTVGIRAWIVLHGVSRVRR